MQEVSPGRFDAVVDSMRFVELEFHPDSKKLWANSQFYGVEVGEDVLVLQKWNNDFCTSSFKIPNAMIIACNGKYTVLPKSEDRERTRIEVRDVPKDLPEANEFESDPSEPTMEERFAAIKRSDYGGPELSKEFYEDDKPITPSTVLNAVKDNFQVSISTGERPVMTKGRAKPEEKAPAQQKLVTRQKSSFQYTPTPQPIYEPEPEPEPPKEDFGDW